MSVCEINSLSACRKGVFNCFLKDVMVSVIQVDFSSAFHQRGTEKVKVLESDFLPHCEGTRRRSFSDMS